jgi:hypothetical protein
MPSLSGGGGAASINNGVPIEFADSVKEQLRCLTAAQRTLLLDGVEKQLTHEPLTETRNRMPLRPLPAGAVGAAGG